MHFLSDILLATAAIGAAIFCLVLSRRLRALTTLDSGMGKAIAVLSSQVDSLSRSLKTAQQTARTAAQTLESQNKRAEAACRKLELLLASLHDLPTETPASATGPGPVGPPHARPLTSWTGTANRRVQPVPPTTLPDPGAQKAPRVLRRRPGAGMR
ncbi:MAG: hypothetical protein JJU15_09905 [Pararhodobacter sp.]|nr:hypothetical protein [Pararhodobacter sp.]